MKEIYEMKGAGYSIRGIAEELGVARHTVRRYPCLRREQALKSPEAMKPKPRPRRASKLDPYTEYVDRRMSEGLENCVVLHRELRDLGYDGGYSILKSYVSPRRRGRQPDATVRFETVSGEQAQVDWGSLSLLGRRREQATHLGLHDDIGLVTGLLRGTGPAGGHRRLHPVPHQRLRGLGSRTPPTPLRQRQGDHSGPG